MPAVCQALFEACAYRRCQIRAVFKNQGLPPISGACAAFEKMEYNKQNQRALRGERAKLLPGTQVCGSTGLMQSVPHEGSTSGRV